MQNPVHQSNESGSSSEVSYFLTLLRGLDPKIAGLGGIYPFGLQAMQAVMLGLSRPFNPTSEDVSCLIDQWERRDKECCYKGSVQDLLSLKDTMIFAISYRHAQKEEDLDRKAGRKCKFRPCDEELFKSAIEAFGKSFPRMMVWCDQILSTRLKHDGTTFKWHFVGLLPYMAFTLLHLSSDISEDVLEKRVWIRAERSLGRMALGFIKADEASCMDTTRNILHPGRCLHGWDCMKNACRHILSGYWPQEHGYWKPDFDLMRNWTLGVLCRGGRNFFDIPLFREHEKVDNTEVLSSFGEFATMPLRTKQNEPFTLTNDKQFFLKATAWNLHVRKIWEGNTPYISHYMGQIEEMRFSWWQCESVKTLFGCMIYHSYATTVIAIETNTGYKVFRGNGNRLLYVHGEGMAGPNTKEQIQKTSQKVGIDLPEDLEWKLLYCSDNCDKNDIRTAPALVSVDDGLIPRAELMIAPVFRGMTTKLFKCAIAKGGGDRRAAAQRICEYVAEWNDYVTSTYTEWMTVRDTTFGPVWLEGYDEESISFGFLEFLTHALILNRRLISSNIAKLADASEVVMEVKELSARMGDNERCLVSELFSDQDEEGDIKLSRRDIVRYILCGGRSKRYDANGLFAFLQSFARSRKYWQTMAVCRNGVMQIRFTDSNGEKRIAQRRSGLTNYSANGIVHPDDYEAVKEISMSYDTSTDDHLMMVYWEEMEDTTTRGDMMRVLKESQRMFEETPVLLADMSTGKDEDGYLNGSGNVFRHDQDPYWMTEMVRSGEEEQSGRHWDDLNAINRIDAEEVISFMYEDT